MSYTYNDFVMEAAMVEATNDTEVSDIQMEQWNAEFNVACAAFDALRKYSLIAEYAQCDVEEFVQESLDDKINKVDDWKNSGGKMKKVLGTIVSGLLKAFRAVAKFFKNLFSKENNPFAKAARFIKKYKEGKHDREIKKGVRKIEKEATSNKGLANTVADMSGEMDAKDKKIAYLERKCDNLVKQAKHWASVARGYATEYDKLVTYVGELKNALKKSNSEKDRLQGVIIEKCNMIDRCCENIFKQQGMHNKAQGKKYSEEGREILRENEYKDFADQMPTLDTAEKAYESAANDTAKATASAEKVVSVMEDLQESIANGEFGTEAMNAIKNTAGNLNKVVQDSNNFGKAAQKLTVSEAGAAAKQGLPSEYFV
jgi:chromosome segregation ATPase